LSSLPGAFLFMKLSRRGSREGGAAAATQMAQATEGPQLLVDFDTGYDADDLNRLRMRTASSESYVAVRSWRMQDGLIPVSRWCSPTANDAPSVCSSVLSFSTCVRASGIYLYIAPCFLPYLRRLPYGRLRRLCCD